jgi:acetoin utilization deacetylase AcuC-like enzyme
MPTMTILYTDPLFLQHDTGRHPETAERLRAITARLEGTGILGRCTLGTYRPMSVEEVQGIHAGWQIQMVRDMAESGGGDIDGDTVVSPASFQVGLAAAGACADAVDAVLAGSSRNALCLVRPPGHHATPTRCMGFCLFNNIALAARRAIARHQINRILIVDWDVHHGNGTQDIFYEDPQVMFFSIHRYGRGFYPGTGARDEIGHRQGVGLTMNAPVPYGTSRQEYRSTFTHFLEKSADKIKPELVLLSAGFDAHAKDPIGSLGLEIEDFVSMTQLVLEVARTHAGGRLVSCLEGGYNREVLAEAVQAHLEELLAEHPGTKDSGAS